MLCLVKKCLILLVLTCVVLFCTLRLLAHSAPCTAPDPDWLPFLSNSLFPLSFYRLERFHLDCLTAQKTVPVIFFNIRSSSCVQICLFWLTGGDRACCRPALLVLLPQSGSFCESMHIIPGWSLAGSE